MKRLSTALVLAALALGSAACGIPLSASPHKLSRSALPLALTKPPPTPSGHAGSSKGETVYIYLIADISGDLVRVPRTVARPATVQRVLDSLEVGPLSQDYRVGDESAVNTNSHLVAVGPVESGTATVQLDRYFFQLQGEAPVQELAQIVWSLTQSDLGVQRVRFVSAAGPLAVETEEGRFVDRPVTEYDYKDLVVSTHIPTGGSTQT